VAKPSIKTMATDGISVYYNPEFMDTLTAAELEGTLAHEVMHPALQHHTRRSGRDQRRWNMACDYTINPMLIEAGLIFEDVTEKAGLEGIGYGIGVVVGDFDNDGYEDLYVTAYGGNRLDHNNGNGTFTEVSTCDDPQLKHDATALLYEMDAVLLEREDAGDLGAIADAMVAHMSGYMELRTVM